MIGRLPALFIVVLWLGPLGFLLAESVHGDGRGFVWWIGERGWQLAARTTLENTLWVTIIASLVGWPLGVMIGLSDRSWRLALQVLCVVPVLVPPFLWAIGWSYLQNRAPTMVGSFLDGRLGLLVSGLTTAIPLTALISSSAIRAVSRSQWEWALVQSGPWAARWLAARLTLPIAAGASAIAALLTASDAGAGQIMGNHGLAAEVLVSLASRQALGEAAAKAVAGLVMLLPLALISAWPLARWSRQLGRHRSGDIPWIRLDWLISLALLLGLLLALFLPLAGLLSPIARDVNHFYLNESLTLLLNSIRVTCLYSLGGGVVAAMAGWCLAQAMQPLYMRTAGLVACLLAVALPSSLRALGWIAARDHSTLLRETMQSEWVIAAFLGLHWCPLAALILTPAMTSLPQSWTDRRRLIGISWFTWTRRVAAPALASWLGLAILIPALFILADVTSLTLLQPPGESAFTSHVFAIMDNSMEMVVASRCVAMFIIPATLALVIMPLAWWTGRTLEPS